MTIDGVNLSNDPLDNPVKVGNNWCYIISTNATQITCRVAETLTSEISIGQVLVFLRT